MLNRLKYTKNKIILNEIILIILLGIFCAQNSALIKISSIYSALGIVTIILLLIITLINLSDYYKGIIQIKKYIFLILIQLIIVVLLYGLNQENNISYIRDVILCLLFILVGYSCSKISLIKYLFYFSFFCAISAITIVIFIAGGLNINEQYLGIPKNQIAPLYVQGVIGGIFYLRYSIKRGIKAYIMIISLVILIGTLLILRGRTAMLALALCSIIYIFLYIKSKKGRFYVLLAMIPLIAYFSPTIYKSFFLNYDVSESDSFTAGRTSVYNEAILILDNNPLMGKLFQNSNVSSQIHNYILSIYFELGIFSLPLLIIYMLLLYQIYKMIKLRNISGLLLLVLFITSLSEYTFPYAPGSATFFAFFLYGMNLKTLNSK